MRFLRVAGVVALVYLVALAGFALAMRQPFDRFAMLMAKTGPVPFMVFPFEPMWKSARAGRLQVGDAAPDFELPLVDRTGSVRLGASKGVRPVVLVFGSYT